MWIALLSCSWTIEVVAGAWFCYHYWMFTQWRYYGDASVLGPGYAVVQLYNGLMTSWYHTYVPHRHPTLLTQEQVAWFFVVVYVAFHALALMRGLSAPARERHRLGVRRRPSVREIARFDRAFATLAQARATIPGAPPLRRPRWWQMRDGRGMRMRSGRILLYPLWMKYWRDRVFACDEYAARLGQNHQLVRALDDLKWTLDGNTASEGGRWLREAPYVESRIDRLLRYQATQAQTV